MDKKSIFLSFLAVFFLSACFCAYPTALQPDDKVYAQNNCYFGVDSWNLFKTIESYREENDQNVEFLKQTGRGGMLPEGLEMTVIFVSCDDGIQVRLPDGVVVWTVDDCIKKAKPQPKEE
jgi:hypothetical protein